VSDLILYFPITFVVLLVLETCKRDSVKEIAIRTLTNFGILTGGLVLGGILVFLINKYL
jgi:hypothetical protein